MLYNVYISVTREVFMKKVFVLFICLFCVNFIFAQENYPFEFEGTYIPLSFYEKILQTSSYSQSIKETKGIKFFDVLCLKNNEFWSNIKFHDGFKLKDNQINFDFLTEPTGKYLLDKGSGIKYKFISESTDYYSVYRHFLFENVLLKNLPTGFENVKAENDCLYIFNKEWKIDIDQYHYYNDLALIIYNYENRITYKLGLQKKDDKFLLYTLKDGEDLAQLPEREILPLKFKSEKEFTFYVNKNYKMGDEFYDKKEYKNAIKHYENVINAYVCFYPELINTEKAKNKVFQTYYYSIYNVACCYSLQQNYEEDYATDIYLFFALNSGYPHIEYLLNDKDLEFTFNHFRSLKEKIIKDFGK